MNAAADAGRSALLEQPPYNLPDDEDTEEHYEDDVSDHANDEPMGWGPDGPAELAGAGADDEEGTRGLRDMFRRLLGKGPKKPAAPEEALPDVVPNPSSSSYSQSASTGVNDITNPGPGPTKSDQQLKRRPHPMGQAPLPKVLGPCLRFGGYDPGTQMFSASVLVVTKDAAEPEPPPVLKFWDPRVDATEEAVYAIKLVSFGGFSFWRFNMAVQAAVQERAMEYNVSCLPDKGFHFSIAGINQKWNWGFYSCNGFDNQIVEKKFGGIQPLWHDVIRLHSLKTTMHVMVGGGDQIYNDNVWELSSLAAWIKIKKEKERLLSPFTPEMEEQVSSCYFRNYMLHWDQYMFAGAMTAVPQLMIWDDHDIFDGWGSYPPELQSCAVFQGVFKCARKFYLLFQQHSTEDRMHLDNNVFGQEGWSQLTCFGSSTAVLVLDTRTERTRKQIIKQASWDIAKHKLSQLPASVRHLVVVATVPVIYPKVKVLDCTIEYLAGKGRVQKGIQKFLQKSGLAGSFYSQFGEPEIWDDLLDHWGADVHKEEKLSMLTMLQELAESKAMRVTFLSGDVHVAAAAKFVSNPTVEEGKDHRLMLQVISSAIGNEPPPAVVVKVLNAFASSNKVNNNTKEKPINLFGKRKQMIKGARNWCIITESDNTPMASLNFQIRVEGMGRNNGKIHVYHLSAPPLGIRDMAPINSAPVTAAAASAFPDANQPNINPCMFLSAPDYGGGGDTAAFGVQQQGGVGYYKYPSIVEHQEPAPLSWGSQLPSTDGQLGQPAAIDRPLSWGSQLQSTDGHAAAFPSSEDQAQAAGMAPVAPYSAQHGSHTPTKWPTLADMGHFGPPIAPTSQNGTDVHPPPASFMPPSSGYPPSVGYLPNSGSISQNAAYPWPPSHPTYPPHSCPTSQNTGYPLPPLPPAYAPSSSPTSQDSNGGGGGYPFQPAPYPTCNPPQPAPYPIITLSPPAAYSITQVACPDRHYSAQQYEQQQFQSPQQQQQQPYEQQPPLPPPPPYEQHQPQQQQPPYKQQQPLPPPPPYEQHQPQQQQPPYEQQQPQQQEQQQHASQFPHLVESSQQTWPMMQSYEQQPQPYQQQQQQPQPYQPQQQPSQQPQQQEQQQPFQQQPYAGYPPPSQYSS